MSLAQRITGIRYPDHLPILSGVLTTALVSAWLLAPVIAEESLGRPSSMAGLGFFFSPAFGLLCGAVAFLIAMGLRQFARRAGVRSIPLPAWVLVCVLLATAASITVLSVNARTQVAEKELLRRPRVIVESTRFVKVDQAPVRANARTEAPLLFSIIPAAVTSSIEWNGRVVSLVGSGERVTVLDSDGSSISSTDLHAFDYIGCIHAMPVCRDQAGRQDLAVLVTLRPTSSRSMLILYGPDGTVVYQEHLERTGTYSTASPMYAANRDGHDILVVEHGSVSAWACSPR